MKKDFKIPAQITRAGFSFAPVRPLVRAALVISGYQKRAGVNL